jgi:SAM-dependent methyltransferase
MDWQELEQLIKVKQEEITKAIQQAALDCPGDEATFRNRISLILHDFCKSADVPFETREEYRLDSGIADAVSDRLVLEYKAPNFLQKSRDATPNQRAIDKIEGYIEDVARREQRDIQKMAGVILDGHYFIFLRKLERGWQDDSIVGVGARSVEQFLRLLVFSSTGIALTPENLVKDFGIEQPRTQRFIQSLEISLRNAQDPLVGKLFEQWKTFFSQAIEYKEAFSSSKLRELANFAQKLGVDLKEPEAFFFAIHTYYALLVKLISWLALSRYKGAKLGAPVFAKLATLSSDELKRELSMMEKGGIFRDYYLIRNLLEGDFFSWYLNAWNEQTEIALRELIQKLNDYDPTTLEENPQVSRDLLKKLYHYIMPRNIRHNLGEYYTPDWLAQRLLNQVNIGFFTDDPATSAYLRNNLLRFRFLDPACGSGTFLALIIARIREAAKQLQLPEKAVLDAIRRNVVGIDLNPLAVITARTTYILALGELLDAPGREAIDIPVFLADSIVTPSKGEDLWSGGKYRLPTSVGEFWVPEEVIDRQRFDTLCEVLDTGVRDEIKTDTFLERCRLHLKLEEKAFDRAKPVLAELYEKILGLHRNHFDGLWARILRNGFAPLFIGKFDYVVGNPPWINWENLPDTYRDRKEVRSLWQNHGLFAPVSGMDTILGKAKYDISVLMTYQAMQRYLGEGGRLGFVITQSVFKTAGAGQGFRRFMLGDSTPIKVLQVDDMAELNPFEGASNRTSVVVLEKGKPTTYPVQYIYWKKTAKGKPIGFDSELADVMSITKRFIFGAEPVDARDKTSAWLTGRPLAIKAVKKVLGKSDYQAHEGVNTGGANGVYWLEIMERLPNGLVRVLNITKGQRRKVESAPAVVEADLLYPLLRGGDVQKWHAETKAWILVTHLPDMKLKAIPEEEMQLQYENTYHYLKQFEDVLRQRAAYKRYFSKDAPFYSMFDVGTYTFAPYKVVWARIGSSIAASVIGKDVIPQETLTIISRRTKDEAHYLCAMLNSEPFNFAAISYSQTGGKSFGSPHVLENICIPKFDPQNSLHLRLAELSEKAHDLAATGEDKALSEVEEAINHLSAKLWVLSEDELAEIKKSLDEIS